MHLSEFVPGRRCRAAFAAAAATVVLLGGRLDAQVAGKPAAAPARARGGGAPRTAWEATGLSQSEFQAQLLVDPRGDIVVAGGCGSESDDNFGLILKYGANGKPLFQKTVRCQSCVVSIRAAAVDARGDIYVAGNYSAEIEFDGKKLRRMPGFISEFVAKYQSDGRHLWSFGLTGPNVMIRGIGVDAQGQVSLVGLFKAGDVSFMGVSYPVSDGLSMVRLSADGEYQSHKQLTPAGTFNLYRVVSDGKGDLIVLASILSPLPSRSSAAALRPHGGSDVFLARYALDGTERWSRHYGGPDKSWVSQLEMDVDAQGNIVVVGDVDPPAIDLGTGPLAPTVAAQAIVPPKFPFGPGRPEPRRKGIAFLARYDASGAPLWSRFLAIEGTFTRKTVAFDSAGNVWLSGYSPFEIEVDGTAVSRSGEQLGYLIKLDGRGKHRWSTRFGASQYSGGLRLARGSAGAVYLLKNEGAAGSNDYRLSKLTP